MKINGGPSAMALQHMAARAQETRKTTASDTAQTTIIPASSPESPPASEPLASGNNVSSRGESLPPTTGTQNPDHATGLDRAIEMLQQNAAKSPEAKGLQQALEMLHRNQERAGTVDIQA